MKKPTLTMLLLLSVTVTGCATIEPKPGFNEVGAQITNRVGKQIHWRKGGPEDAEVAARVREMLRGRLTVEEAVQIALLGNPRLQAVYEGLGIAQADLVQAGLLRNPVFGAVLREPRGEDHNNLDFDISWDFLGVLTYTLRTQAAQRDFEVAKLRVTAEVMNLASEVRAAFIEAQANQQMVEMLRQVADGTDAALLAAQRLREAGNITGFALDQHAVMHNEARLMLASAEALSLASREKLNVLMGVWGTATQWVMDARLPPVPGEAVDTTNIEKQAVEQSLELAMLRLEMERNAKRVGLENFTSLLPDLEIGYVWERDDGAWEDGPSLELQIPIFDFGQGRRARAWAMLEQLQARYVAKAIEIRSAARRAALTTAAARARERHLREVLLPLRERIVQGMQLEYNAMQIGVFRLLQIQQQQVMTGRQYVEALRDYWLARNGAQQIMNGGMADMTMSATAMASGAAMSAGADAGGH